MQKMYSKVLSILLTVCIIGSMLPTVAFAEEGVQDSGTSSSTSEITAFADLAEDVALQEVETGTTLVELNLPSTLTVTVTTGSAMTVTVTTGSAMTATVSGESDVATDSDAQETETQEETTVEVSNWVADPDYDSDTAGDYTFTPTLTIPEGTTLADGVTAPQITVTVEETAVPILRGTEMQLLGSGTDTDITADFTDANFLAAVYAKISKTAPEAIYDTDVSGVTFLDVIGKSISSLAGIEHFTALTYLDCSSNQLTTLDMSSNTNLSTLNCSSNQLDTLGVSSNTKLSMLICSTNQLTTLDVSSNTKLSMLICSANRLTTLDVRNNTALNTLDCHGNYMASESAVTGLNRSLTTKFTFDPQKSSTSTYAITVNSGTASPSTAAENATVTITANTPESGMRFKEWTVVSGGVTLASTTSATTTFDMPANAVEVTATYESITASGTNITDKFTDANFLAEVRKALNKGVGMPILDTYDFASVKNLLVSSKSITSLAGIEYFTELTTLDCSTNQLTALDVSNNTALIELYCYDNRLSTLNVSQNTAFTKLDCNNNRLTALDVSNNTMLTNLWCNGNQLTALDVSKNAGLIGLWCNSNQLSALDVSNNTALTTLNCSRNYMVSEAAVTGLNKDLTTSFTFLPQKATYTITVNSGTANPSIAAENATVTITANAPGSGKQFKEWTVVSGGVTLASTTSASTTFTMPANAVEVTATYENISAGATDITAKFKDSNFLAAVYAKIGKTAPEAIYVTDVSGITFLEVIDKSISSLAGIEHFAALIYLNCNNNQLTALDMSNNTALTQLYCNSNQLTTLDVSNNTALTQLYCNSNQLTTLDVSNNTALTTLYCYSNRLTSLNVSGDTALTDLNCYSNRLTSLDVSGDTALTTLKCNDNQLTGLDVSKNTALTHLSSNNNRLTSLDLTQNTSLTSFSGINQAVSLTMAGSGGSYSAGVSMPTGTTFGNAALSYAGGTLTSTSNAVLAPTFTAPTGLSEKNITGTLTLTYEDIPAGALAITQHPQNVSAKIGEDATFRIVAENATSYQWYASASINDIPQGDNGKIVDTVGRVSGATTATLTLYNVTEKMNGETIYCMVTGANPSDIVRSNPANLTVTVVTPTKYAVNVNNGTASLSTAAAGANVTITADTAPSGKRFKEWTVVSGGVTLASTTSASTTFTMPANAVEVTATYEPIPAGVTPVTGVTLNKNSLSLYSNTTPKTVALTATIAPSNATDKSVTWKSSNTAVATVDASGNVKAAGNGTANITATTTDGGYTAICTVTVSTYSSGGGSSSGGSSGGGSSSSGSGSTTTTTTTEKKPNQPVTAATPVTATAGKNGTANASIPDKSISDAITKAQADAKAQGKTKNGVSVALNVTMPKGATALTATLTRSSLNSLVSAGVTNLEINGSPVTVTFDKKALTEIQKKSSGNINITIAPKTNLSETAKKMIGSRPVYNITIGYGDNSTVSSFGDGVATVAIPYTPANGEAIGGVYAVYVDEKGNATRIAGSAYDANSGCIIFTTPHFSMYGVGYTAPSAQFTDISSHWAKESIDYVVGRGLLSGTTETTFAPDTAMTRGMLVTALGRLAGVDTKAYTTSSFTDVNADSAYRPYIEWAYKKGMIQGIGSNQFAPDRAITREEIAVIIANFAKATGYTLPVTREATTYADASSISSTYKTAVTAMQQAGIMMGGTSNKFNPKSNATRAEVSSMLNRYIKLTIDPDTAQGWTLNDAGQYLYYKDGKVLTGTQTIDGVKYVFNSNGVLQTGWVKDGDNWRFYSGTTMLVGWWDLGANGNNKTYYFAKDGLMVSGKWLEIDGKWYYFNTDGSLARSTKIDGYEVDENGVRKTK